MEKEFVPYELAVKLKELGFDEPCFFAFDNCSTPTRCTDLRTNEQKFNGVNYNSSSYTSQPTLSQAFRWFREKYNYNQSIVFTKHPFGTDEYQYMVLLEDDECVEINFKTYEEAELDCLDKLIQIVENK